MSLFDFFRSKQEKPLVKGYSLGTIQIMHETSADIFYQFYERNAYIASVVNKIRTDVGAHGYEIRRYKKSSEEAMKQFVELIKASIGYTPRQFIKRLMRDFEITGNAYVYIAKDGTKATGIQVLDPRYVKPIMKPTGEVIGYVQNLGGIRVFTRDEVFHLRDDTDLKLECLGRSKMEALFVDLETDREARDSNLAFFKNNQTPAAIIVVEDDFELGETEEEELKNRREMKEILESGKFLGGKNHHRASVMQGIKDVIKVQDKIDDMQFLNMRKFTLELVCAVYNVNKDVLGFTDTSNRSVGGIQSETYYFSIEEKEQMIDEFMTKVIQSAIGSEFTYVTIKDNLRTLIVKGDLATNLYEKGLITRNEGRELLQYDPVADQDSFAEKQDPKEVAKEKEKTK